MSEHPLTLGESLSVPMVPDDNPPVLKWQTAMHTLDIRGPIWVLATVSLHPLADTDKRWRADCAGPHGTNLDDWFATDTEAMIAVEEHIAYAVGQHLEGTESS